MYPNIPCIKIGDEEYNIGLNTNAIVLPITDLLTSLHSLTTVLHKFCQIYLYKVNTSESYMLPIVLPAHLQKCILKSSGFSWAPQLLDLKPSSPGSSIHGLNYNVLLFSTKQLSRKSIICGQAELPFAKCYSPTV